MSKYFMSFEEVDELANKVAKKVKGLDLENVYGQPRGGLVPAVMLSHKLGIPLITDFKEISSKTLFVDEIIDSGKTLIEIEDKLNGAVVVSLTKRYTSKYEPYYFAKLVEDDAWLVFPWEEK
ncbi:MAG: phosphoribosyltransferase [Candidatus Woesearchaeota archaeon]